MASMTARISLSSSDLGCESDCILLIECEMKRVPISLSLSESVQVQPQRPYDLIINSDADGG